MNQLTEIASKLLISEGANQSYLPQIKFFKNLQTTEKMELLYNQGIIFMLSGEKCIYTPTCNFTYNPDNFVVLTVPMPLSCQAFSQNGEPMIAMLMDIETTTLNSLINQMEDCHTIGKIEKGDKDKGIFVSDVDDQIRSALYRLLKSLQCPIEAKILGPDIIKEIIYYILKKKESSPLYALAMKNTNLSKIENALKEVQHNYANQFDVETLAKSVNMSVSSFHQTFKNVTSSSPIQYLKKIRLSKAREFLIEQKLSVAEAANSVGYDSVSQFNREFKRYFGITPGSINK